MKPIKILKATDGTEPAVTDEGMYTLAAGPATYYAELYDNADDTVGWSIHYDWNAALIATITVEKSNRAVRAGVAGGSVTAWAATGWGATSAPAVSPAASALESVVEYSGDMAGRRRLKIVVTTAGTMRAWEHSKSRGAR
jgi:hypothetical protein